jgi:hypothetical protein
MTSRLAFDHKMLVHINESRISEGKNSSRMLELLVKLLGLPFIFIPLGMIEKLLGILLTLPVPLYSSLMYSWINTSRGLPVYVGMYLRALYYRRLLNVMESNVFIDQRVAFAYPKGITLRAFSYIDKRVMIFCKKAIVGR